MSDNITPTVQGMTDAAFRYIINAANAARTLDVGLTYWITVVRGERGTHNTAQTRRSAIEQLWTMVNADGDPVTGIKVSYTIRDPYADAFTIGNAQ